MKSVDSLQLQQKIIYYKAELAKYQNKVSMYENDYHYSQLKQLKEENLELLKEKSALQQEINTIHEHYQKEIENIKVDDLHATKDHLDSNELVEQLKDKDDIISQMQEEMERLQMKYKSLQANYDKLFNENITSDFAHQSKETSFQELEILTKLDNHFKNLIELSLNNDKETNPKFDLIDELEMRIEEITTEINQLQNEIDSTNTNEENS
ncbi:hypothetical protein ACERII_06565 [Evansella sp. AB-rgal1]|uniref:hypothetical protein n=1 Tax=Evansella sp. AB-rgal1 TaxID=3242696 RepID=UPI00359EFEFB